MRVRMGLRGSMGRRRGAAAAAVAALCMSMGVGPVAAQGAVAPTPPVPVSPSVSAPAASLLGPEPDPSGDRITAVVATPDGGLSVTTTDTASPAEATAVIERSQATPDTLAIAVDHRVSLVGTAGAVDDTMPDTGNAAVNAAKHASAAAGGAAVAVAGTAACPNYTGYQWNGGVMGWTYGQDAADVTVAVIDSGTDASHPDLAGRVLAGKDYVDPAKDGRFDGHGHGTHVAGIISAAADTCGVSGMSTAPIVPVRVLGADGTGWDSDVNAAIIWAADHGADIINLSVGSNEWSAVGQVAVDYARSKGVGVIAAAGNWRQFGSPPSFPGAYVGVTAVAATNLDSNFASFSNAGDYLDVAALGVSILSTLPGGQWGYMSGTSQAAPHIAGATAAALQKLRANPADPANYTLCAANSCGNAPGTTGEQGARHVVGAGAARYCSPGLPAIGWDAQTGWGTPSMQRLLYPGYTTNCDITVNSRAYLLPMPVDTYTAVRTTPTPPSKAAVYLAGTRSLHVTWDPTLYHGTTDLTGYTATATGPDGDRRTCQAPPTAANTEAGAGAGCTITGLTNAVPYRVTVTASNTSGTSEPSAPAPGEYGLGDTTRPYGAPDPVTAVTATPGPVPYQLIVAWKPPADTGGAWISSYRVLARDGATIAGTCGGTTGDLVLPTYTCTITNLPATTKTYTITVEATNDYGTTISTPITATTVGPPPAPAGVTGTAADGAIAVTWTPPSVPYPGTISGYRATATSSSYPDASCDTAAGGRACTLTGLTNGVSYEVAVYSLVGQTLSPAALAPARVTPNPSTPGVPAAVAASASDRAIAVTWGPTTEPNRTPAAAYTATATPAAVNSFISPGSCTVAAPATTCTIPGLVNGAVYDVVVTAANAQGTSSGAGAALPVVPALTTVNLPTKVSAGNTYRLAAGAPDATLFANVTVTSAEGPGHLTTYPCRLGKPLASNHNFTAGVSRAVYTVVKADAAGDVCIYASATAHLVWDQGGDNLIVGTGQTSPVVAHSPVRKYDSRTVGAGARLPAGATATIRAGAPGQTILGHVTVTQAAGIGYITAYPCTAGRPTASNLNFTLGATVPNLVAVAADTNGDICLYTSTATHLIWDQEMETAALSGHTPVRKLDTRTSADGAAKVPAGGIRRVHVGGAGQQVLGTLTVTAAEGGGFTTVYTCSDPRPNASASNFQAGVTIANFAGARADANGDICLYTTATTHLIWDQSVEEAAASTDINLRPSPLRILDTRLTAASQG